MPFLKLVTNVPESKIPPNFDVYLTDFLCFLLNKPKEYCSVQLVTDQILTFGGSHEPAALITLMSIGRLGINENRDLSEKIMTMLTETLCILPHLVYINFVDPKPSDVEHNSYE